MFGIAGANAARGVDLDVNLNLNATLEIVATTSRDLGYFAATVIAMVSFFGRHWLASHTANLKLPLIV